MRVLLGVTGGIAAYKVATIVRRLMQDGHTVQVVPTPGSLNFVGRTTWEALSGRPAPSEIFESAPGVEHIRLSQLADIVLVAPATADFLSQLAHGEARDLLGNILLATAAPIVVAPAMHTGMWQNAATKSNLKTLRDRGVHVIEPAVGQLAGEDVGVGRLPEPDHIVDALYAAAKGEKIPTTVDGDHCWGDLEGVRFLISAGGTREPIDPVRFIGNRSSGHQGFALAEAARERGALVTVVAANVFLPLGENISRVDVETSVGLAREMREVAPDADVVIMAAAVADFRPVTVSANKIKKSDDGRLTLEMEQTEDILHSLVKARRPGQTILGFGAETGDENADVLEHGMEKARQKGADLLIVNPVGEGIGFGDVSSRIMILDGKGQQVAAAEGEKMTLAHAILDAVVELRTKGGKKKGSKVRGWVGGAR
ncbi:MAG: bifunctional phosphopantothenoylcysteine decarboxylase/phosphopantothenate--cysteine ligase CoaBC [Demequinaceae bacterium]|nr:bifunctional phosphopantothenoylcysteine decarboxylase/phosphopantothenate--cysteine ligase CoaBC [Demequinaceae bacterium]